MKLLGIDYGKKRLGLAICGPMKIANPLELLVRQDTERDLKALKAIIEEHEIIKIVIGLPKNMNNTLGEMAQEATQFAEFLEKETQLPIVLWDERLTTVQAERSLIQAGLTRQKRQKSRDSIAAVFMLQSYVDAQDFK